MNICRLIFKRGSTLWLDAINDHRSLKQILKVPQLRGINFFCPPFRCNGLQLIESTKLHVEVLPSWVSVDEMIERAIYTFSTWLYYVLVIQTLMNASESCWSIGKVTCYHLQDLWMTRASNSSRLKEVKLVQRDSSQIKVDHRYSRWIKEIQKIFTSPVSKVYI